MAVENVPLSDALSRIIDAFVMEQGAMYEHAIRKYLPGMADRIEKQLPLFGWKIVKEDEVTSPPAKAP
jgi:hypothetical protein